jgi:hypothetical protein
VLVDGVLPGRCVWVGTLKLSGIGIDVGVLRVLRQRSYPVTQSFTRGAPLRVRPPRPEVARAASVILVCLSSAKALSQAWSRSFALLGVPSRGLACRAFLRPWHVVRNLLSRRLLGHLIRGLPRLGIVRTHIVVATRGLYPQTLAGRSDAILQRMRAC